MRACILLFLALSVLLGCNNAALRREPITDMQPGYRPDIDTDEAGIWYSVGKAEQELQTSGKLIKDPELNQYVKIIVCQIAPDLCDDMRIYIAQIPYFNATMAPNGMMQVWSGLLLRAQNEAQLAYILGHEIAHYKKRHSLQTIRKLRSTTDFLAAFSIVTAVSGVGYAGSIAEIVATGAFLKFSRDHEREADQIGFTLMQHANYDPRESAKLWEGLIAEQEAMDEDGPSLFFSTHPPTAERIATLKQESQQLSASRSSDWVVGKQEFQQAVAPFLLDFLLDELRLRQFASLQIVLDRMKEQQRQLGEVWYVQGELYKTRNLEDDVDKAKAAFLQALAFERVPSDVYRSLGLVCQKLEQNDEAKTWYQQYLEQTPEAFDRAMIQAYIDKL